MTEKKSFPIRFGRGHSKVTLYDRTASLPYYRISYRLGAIRHQRTFKTLKDTKAHAEAVSKKLCSQDVTVTQITGNELVAPAKGALLFLNNVALGSLVVAVLLFNFHE